ncbi:meiotic nuclear division protein 1 [Peniophora sp. CONT]|nr:meiotic nuclear division protein 1 [Peniophora sp. CONT]
MGKGLSFDEKRIKLVELFHETKDFYQLKELEKLAQKMKGITSNTVKDVVEACEQDNLIRKDKVGSSNFFWSFPSQRGVEVKSRHDKATRELADTERKLAEVRAELEAERAKRPQTDERAAAETRMLAVQKEASALEAEQAAYGACDPVVVEQKQRAVLLTREAAIRWTDNYTTTLQWFRNQNPYVEMEQIREMLGITEEYEDIEG